MFPTDRKKLKERINRYRRSLKSDERDGAGKRFLVGPMYMVIEDQSGATNYYAWYKSAFPDDSPEPFNHLCWALAVYKTGNAAEATVKLCQKIFANLYLVPHVLGVRQQSLKIWHGSNWAELEYARDLPPELLNLWDDTAKAWAASVFNDPAVASERARFIEIESRLLDVKPGPERSALVTESFRIRDWEARLSLVQPV